MEASWDYFETGHWKRACNRIGAVAKSAAADAIEQGNVQIQDAHDFHTWTVSKETSIKYILYTAQDYQVACEEIKAVRTLNPISRTFTIHSVRNNPNGVS